MTTESSTRRSPILALPRGDRPAAHPAEGSATFDRYRVPDELWGQISPIITRMDPPRTLGRKRIDPRAALDAIIYRMLTRCPWNRLPDAFPDDSAIHRTYQRWKAAGLLNEIWALLLSEQRDRSHGAERDGGAGRVRSQAG
jgi:transposase